LIVFAQRAQCANAHLIDILCKFKEKILNQYFFKTKGIAHTVAKSPLATRTIKPAL
jgi:hypothetical protein